MLEKENTKSINQQILSVALPLFGNLIIPPLLIAMDTAFVGRLGTNSLAALSISSIIFFTSFSIFIFLSFGTNSQVGKKYGAGKIKEAYSISIQNIWLAIFIASIVCFFIYCNSYNLPKLLGVSEQVALLSSDYLVASILALFCILISLPCVGTFRGTLNTVEPFIYSIIGALANVVLIVLFIIGFQWGLTGAGWAMSLSEVFIVLPLIVKIIRKSIKLKVSFKPNLQIIKALFQNIPLFIRSLSINASILTVGYSVSHLGTENIATHQIVNSINIMVILMIDSVGTACQSLIAVEMGRKDREKLIVLTKKCVKASLTISTFIGVSLIAFSPILPMIFTEDTTLQSKAIIPIILIGALICLTAFALVADGILIGAGDTWYLATISVINYLIYATALYLVHILIPIEYGLIAVWICIITIFYGLRGILNGHRLFSYKWVKL